MHTLLFKQSFAGFRLAQKILLLTEVLLLQLPKTCFS
ncbi:hypothetical protein SAMN05444412_106101 [Rhodonellum ikkaensis]|uniref:Uncharacterized protein n=1 Tax=Rhodonellum ikkaensis TaxID=336829 RepID=A0A1H3QJJ5_9BACT|nr:hypothetical protein SAMN05444412_106101 [Rhodonellum ikkaensis]